MTPMQMIIYKNLEARQMVSNSGIRQLLPHLQVMLINQFLQGGPLLDINEFTTLLKGRKYMGFTAFYFTLLIGG